MPGVKTIVRDRALVYGIYGKRHDVIVDPGNENLAAHRYVIAGKNKSWYRVPIVENVIFKDSEGRVVCLLHFFPTVLIPLL